MDSTRTGNTKAYAAIRFMGDALDPTDVTRRLGLPPDMQHRRHEPHVARNARTGRVRMYTPWTSGLWSMSSERWVKSDKLEVHLKWLLADLEPHAHAIAELMAQGTAADFFCYSLGTSRNPPSISRATRARAAALGVKIAVDHYCVRPSRDLKA